MRILSLTAILRLSTRCQHIKLRSMIFWTVTQCIWFYELLGCPGSLKAVPTGPMNWTMGCGESSMRPYHCQPHSKSVRDRQHHLSRSVMVPDASGSPQSSTNAAGVPRQLERQKRNWPISLYVHGVPCVPVVYSPSPSNSTPPLPPDPMQIRPSTLRYSFYSSCTLFLVPTFVEMYSLSCHVPCYHTHTDDLPVGSYKSL